MLTLVKLGGSFITDKSKPETVLHDRLRSIAEELAYVPGPKMLIHGGGSFGHYNALKYGIDNPLGISKTRKAMLRLSLYVAEALEEQNLKPVIFPGGSHFIIRIVAGDRIPTPVNFYPIERAIHRGMLPITYGDVTLELHKVSSKITIISGDEIAYAIASFTSFKYDMRVIMISDVEGIYVRKGGPLIKKIDASSLRFWDVEGNEGDLEEIEFRDVKDATGGMKAKLFRALRIAQQGIEVIFSNSILKALRGEGTRIVFRKIMPLPASYQLQQGLLP